MGHFAVDHLENGSFLKRGHYKINSFENESLLKIGHFEINPFGNIFFEFAGYRSAFIEVNYYRKDSLLEVNRF